MTADVLTLRLSGHLDGVQATQAIGRIDSVRAQATGHVDGVLDPGCQSHTDGVRIGIIRSKLADTSTPRQVSVYFVAVSVRPLASRWLFERTDFCTLCAGHFCSPSARPSVRQPVAVRPQDAHCARTLFGADELTTTPRSVVCWPARGLTTTPGYVVCWPPARGLITTCNCWQARGMTTTPRYVVCWQARGLITTPRSIVCWPARGLTKTPRYVVC